MRVEGAGGTFRLRLDGSVGRGARVIQERSKGEESRRRARSVWNVSYLML